MDAKQNTHEVLRAHKDVTVGSDRSFGLIFSAFFVAIALFPLFFDGTLNVWALVLAGAFLSLALFFPNFLKPMKLLWFKFGLLLHSIINPIVMGLIFFLSVFPIGLVFRLMGKDILSLKIDKSAESYWVKRDPVGPKPESMKQQF
jgi:hypothetical protein